MIPSQGYISAFGAGMIAGAVCFVIGVLGWAVIEGVIWLFQNVSILIS